VIRINGHLGAAVLPAFPAMPPRRHGAHTALTGLLDQLAVIEALSLDHDGVPTAQAKAGPARPA
jgi:hypothetical protein